MLFLISAVTGFGFISQARASLDSSDALRELNQALVEPSTLSPEEAYRRTQAVLDHFNVPAEPSYQSEFDSLQGTQTLTGIQELLPNLDPQSESAKFMDFQNSSLRVYQDASAWQVPDFDVTLTEKKAPDTTLSDRLAEARKSTLPLQGLRIALDPGHMGSDAWAQITGKWVQDSNGHQINEGLINLQTALLVEQKLTALGAQVMITHRVLGPVTDVDYNSFDPENGELQALRESQLVDWFVRLLAVAPPGPQLYNAFQGSSDFKALFNPGQKETYYNDLDLQARVDAIDAFRPDITLIMHYDADVHTVSTAPPFTRDATKVYVPGSFAPTELASRRDRADFAKLLMDNTTFSASVALAHQIVTALHQNLKIPYAGDSPGETKELEPGLFCRNLYLLKKHHQSATAYIESFFYNDQGEFSALLNATHSITIGGQNYPYSDRLDIVAESIKEGVLQFVANGF